MSNTGGPGVDVFVRNKITGSLVYIISLGHISTQQLRVTSRYGTRAQNLTAGTYLSIEGSSKGN